MLDNIERTTLTVWGRDFSAQIRGKEHDELVLYFHDHCRRAEQNMPMLTFTDTQKLHDLLDAAQERRRNEGLHRV